jgi:hypothetical protein
MSTNSNVPGLTYPTVQAPLAGSPGASAIAARTATINKQAALSNAVSGGSKRKRSANKRGANKRKRGANKRGGAIAVPQIPGDTSGANAVIAQNARNSTQAAANAQYDKVGGTMKKGGRRRRRTKKRRHKK